jgi:membrane-associated HD superfamily phosphohydrolase
MLLSTVVFPYVYQKLSGKTIIILGGTSIGIYYVLLVLFGGLLNDIKVLLYGGVALITFMAGLLVTFLSLYVNVTFMKSVEKEYIARSAAIMNASGASAIPITSFIISALVAVISTEKIFIAAGIILVLIIVVLAFSLNFEIKQAKSIENGTETDAIRDEKAENDLAMDSLNIEGKIDESMADEV